MAPISHHVEPGKRRSATRGSPASRLFVTALVSLLILTGCSGGDANEARRGQRQAGNQTPVLLERQATYSVERFGPGSPTPDTSPNPRPRLVAIGLAPRVRSDNAPDQLLGAVPANAGTVFLVAEVSGVLQGQPVSVTIQTNEQRPEDRQVVGYNETTAESSGQQWIALAFGFDGSLPPAVYAAVLFVDGDFIGSLAFELTPSGSQPRVLPG